MWGPLPSSAGLGGHPILSASAPVGQTAVPRGGVWADGYLGLGHTRTAEPCPSSGCLHAASAQTVSAALPCGGRNERVWDLLDPLDLRSDVTTR